MSFTTTVIGLVIIFASYLIVTEFFLKRRLYIYPKRKGVFSKGRKKLFLAIDILLMIIFFISAISLPVYFPYSRVIHSLPFPFFFFFLSINRGIEEWLVYKKDRYYYQELATAITFFVIIIFIIVGNYIIGTAGS